MPDPNPLPKIIRLAEAALANGSHDAMESALETIIAITRYPFDPFSPTDRRLIELSITSAEWEDLNSGNEHEF